MKPFKKIYIEITNRCNLSCSFCQKSGKTPRTMNVEEFTHILGQIKPYTDYIYLHLKGEPLTHPNLKEILQVCEANQIQVNLTTNGTLLCEHLTMLQQSSALRQVNVSLHAETKNPEVYFNTAIEMGQSLAQMGKYVSFRLWNGPGGENGQEKLLARFPGHYTKGGRTTLEGNLFLSRDSLWSWPSMADPIVATSGTCYGLRTHIGILADGSVVPCCLDGEGGAVLGNLFVQSMEQLWPTVVKHREQMQNRKLSLLLCQKCTYREKIL